MHIKEVEYIVGLSSKNIRYYEDVGLISPSRDTHNDYRIYNDNDINRLKIIKFLRELNVPIKEIKSLYNKELTLYECMNDRIRKIEDEESHYIDIKNMCNEIMKNEDDIEKIDITKYFMGMNIINKEGFTMRDVETDHSKKIKGAIFSSLLFSIFFIFLIVMISYFQFTEADKMPWIIYLILMFFLCFPVIGIGYNLFERIREIKGGEEDEASKY